MPYMKACGAQLLMLATASCPVLVAIASNAAALGTFLMVFNC